MRAFKMFRSCYEGFNDLLYNLTTAWARSMKFVQLAGTGETGDQVSRAAVDDVAVSRPYPAQLAGFQYGLRLAFRLHVQRVLAVSL